MNSQISQKTKSLIETLIYPFYRIERDMDLPIRETPENDAEHSWSLALAACALAPLIDPSLDLGKVAHFAIVHDLVEVYSGDISIWDKNETNHTDKAHNEERALQQLRSENAGVPWIASTIEKYERKDSDEAKFVWSLDKYLAMYMRMTHAAPFFHKHNITKDFFDTGIARMHHKSHAHPKVGELFDELIKEFDLHPEWFAQAKS